MISSVIINCKHERTYCMGCCAFCWVRRNLCWQTLAFVTCWCNLRCRGWGHCRWWGRQGMTLGWSGFSAKSHGDNIVEWGNIFIYRIRCYSDGKNQKIVISRSMGDAWLMRGLVWQIGMIISRNVHAGVLVPESGTFPPWFYFHSNISKLTGGLEDLVVYYCGNLDFQLAVNEHY